MVTDEETRDEFRSKLRSFLRLHKFQSQVVSYADTTLEKLYTFGRFLYKELLQHSREFRVEFNDELTPQYYRLEKSEEGAIELDKSDSEVSVPAETGTGSQEDEDVELSTIVEKSTRRWELDAGLLFIAVGRYKLRGRQMSQVIDGSR